MVRTYYRCWWSAVIALFLLFSMPVVAHGQARPDLMVGDSVRTITTTGPIGWTVGRLLETDSSQLLLQVDSDTTAVPLVTVRRLDRWQHQNKMKLLSIAMSVGIAAGTVAYFVTPEQEQHHTTDGGCVITIHQVGTTSQCSTSTTTTRTRPGSLLAYQMIGAAGGLLGWGIGLAIAPGRWEVVVNR